MSDLILKRLQEIVGVENVVSDPLSKIVYGSDSSVHSSPADYIVRPLYIEHIQQVLKFANSKRIPVVPRGSGSGMSGHAVPIDGGIVLDMKQMNKIVEINPENLYCRVQPGVIDDRLNEKLAKHKLFYPPAPASSNIATIGGEISTNASGIRSVKYGATRDYVLGLKVVLANGDLVNLGTVTPVESSGYQIHRLIVGSEGTLAVIVEATLKLIPIPKFRCLGIC